MLHTKFDDVVSANYVRLPCVALHQARPIKTDILLFLSSTDETSLSSRPPSSAEPLFVMFLPSQHLLRSGRLDTNQARNPDQEADRARAGIALSASPSVSPCHLYWYSTIAPSLMQRSQRQRTPENVTNQISAIVNTVTITNKSVHRRHSLTTKTCRAHATRHWR